MACNRSEAAELFDEPGPARPELVERHGVALGLQGGFSVGHENRYHWTVDGLVTVFDVRRNDPADRVRMTLAPHFRKGSLRSGAVELLEIPSELRDLHVLIRPLGECQAVSTLGIALPCHDQAGLVGIDQDSPITRRAFNRSRRCRKYGLFALWAQVLLSFRQPGQHSTRSRSPEPHAPRIGGLGVAAPDLGERSPRAGDAPTAKCWARRHPPCQGGSSSGRRRCVYRRHSARRTANVEQPVSSAQDPLGRRGQLRAPGRSANGGPEGWEWADEKGPPSQPRLCEPSPQRSPLPAGDVDGEAARASAAERRHDEIVRVTREEALCHR